MILVYRHRFACLLCRRVYAWSLSKRQLGPGTRRCPNCDSIFPDGSIEWPELKRSEMLMVGDYKWDVLCARNAGIPCAVLWDTGELPEWARKQIKLFGRNKRIADDIAQERRWSRPIKPPSTPPRRDPNEPEFNPEEFLDIDDEDD